MNKPQGTAEALPLSPLEESTTPDSVAMDVGLYREVLEDLTEVVCRFTLDGTILYANGVYCRFFGKRLEELVGRQWHPVAVAEDIPHIEAKLATLSLSQPVVAIENRVYDGNGDIHWMEFVNRAFYDADGRITHLQSVGRNITARKQAEIALAINEKRLQLALDAAERGVWDWDVRTGAAYLSRSYWQLTGYAPGEVAPNMDFLKRLVHPDDWLLVADALGRLVHGREQEFVIEYRMVTKSGAIRWVNGKGTVLERDAAGTGVRLAGTVSDITQRKQLGEQLRLTDSRYSTLIDSNVIGIVVATADGRIVEANDYFLDILGYSREEMRRGEVNWRQVTPPEWLPLDDGALAEMRGADVCASYEKEYLTRDGERRAVTIGCARLPGPEGHLLAFVLDITERQRARAEIEQLNAQLEEKVARRTAELQAANRDLESFTYAASHDMRAPLGRINNFSTLLRQRYDGQLDEEGRLFLDLIQQNASRLHQLVEDLLAHARVGQEKPERSPIDLDAAVRVLLHERTEDIQRIGARVRVELPPEIRIPANALVLNQVLRNLLDNALKYSAKATPPAIEIGARQLETGYRIWVRDNGIGIDPAYHRQIFEIFRRLHTYNEFPGSGIGLALVKKAIERMDGRVWVESEPGNGATFFMELPA